MNKYSSKNSAMDCGNNVTAEVTDCSGCGCGGCGSKKDNKHTKDKK